MTDDVATFDEPVTAEALAALPDDGRRYELVAGGLQSMAPAGFEHGEVAARVGALLRRHADDHGLGTVVAAETGFLLSRDPDTVRAPDAAFVSLDRLPPAEQRSGFLALAPDLVVEVVSPSDRADDVAEKVTAWLAVGSRMVWAVYPSQHLVVTHHPDGSAQLLGVDDVIDGEDVLPGLRAPVSSLFEPSP